MEDNNLLDDFEFAEHLFLEESASSDVVAKYYSSLEADIAAARLRSEGIPCFLAGDTARSVMTNLPVILRLHVRPEDLETARSILAEAAVDTEEQPSNNSTHRIIMGAMIVSIVLLLVRLLLAAMQNRD